MCEAHACRQWESGQGGMIPRGNFKNSCSEMAPTASYFTFLLTIDQAV